jgi:hypothetical protein
MSQLMNFIVCEEELATNSTINSEPMLVGPVGLQRSMVSPNPTSIANNPLLGNAPGTHPRPKLQHIHIARGKTCHGLRKRYCIRTTERRRVVRITRGRTCNGTIQVEQAVGIYLAGLAKIISEIGSINSVRNYVRKLFHMLAYVPGPPPVQVQSAISHE